MDRWELEEVTYKKLVPRPKPLTATKQLLICTKAWLILKISSAIINNFTSERVSLMLVIF